MTTVDPASNHIVMPGVRGDWVGGIGDLIKGGAGAEFLIWVSNGDGTVYDTDIGDVIAGQFWSVQNGTPTYVSGQMTANDDGSFVWVVAANDVRAAGEYWLLISINNVLAYPIRFVIQENIAHGESGLVAGKTNSDGEAWTGLLLQNDGPVGAKFYDSENGVTWELTTTEDGFFALLLEGETIATFDDSGKLIANSAQLNSLEIRDERIETAVRSLLKLNNRGPCYLLLEERFNGIGYALGIDSNGIFSIHMYEEESGFTHPGEATVFRVDDSGNMQVAGATVKGTGAKITVENNHGTTAERVLLDLKNRGPVRIRMEDTGTGGVWELGINTSSMFEIKYGSTPLMMMAPNGDAYFQGNVVGNTPLSQ